MVLRVTRCGVGERIEREGKSPPWRTVWPAPRAPRVIEEADRENERDEVKALENIGTWIKQHAVRVDERWRHQQDEPARAQHRRQWRRGDRPIEKKRYEHPGRRARDAEHDARSFGM